VIVVLYNLAAIAGGLCFGARMSGGSGGRGPLRWRGAALPLLPLWALSATPLWIAVGRC
jgi:SHS family lactate transporter-like MFS transporter